jgi:hypothetical protein
MRSRWRLAMTIAAVIGFAIMLAPPDVAEGAVAVYRCSATATRFDKSVHHGSGKSGVRDMALGQAIDNAMWDCTRFAWRPFTCHIIGTPNCDIVLAPRPTFTPVGQPGAAAERQPGAAAAERQPGAAPAPQRLIDVMRQKKIPINGANVLVAVAIHLLWVWHIIGQKMLAVPVKAGLGFGVTVIQALLAYVLGSEGEIALLELPIFVLPLGFGELVACVSFKRRSE